MIKSVVRLALVILLAGALLPATAGAHATIIQTTPTDQQVFRTQPRAVTLKWSEAVDLGAAFDPAARRHGHGDRDRGRAARARRSVDRGAPAAAPVSPTAPTSWPGGSSRRTRIPCRAPFTFSIGNASQVLFDAGGSSGRDRPHDDAFARGVAFWAGAGARRRRRGLRAVALRRRAATRAQPGVGRRGSAARRQPRGLAHAGSIRVRRLDHRRLLHPLIQPRYALRPRARGADVLTLVFLVLLVRGLRLPPRCAASP